MAYMCNTSNIKEMEIGRPQTVMFERGHNAQAKTFPNGTIVTLGDTMENATIPGGATKYGREYDHVHKVTQFQGTAGPGVDSVIGKWIVVAPEIRVEQYRRINDQISDFVLEENVTYTAYQLQKLDRIEYSDSYFTGNLNDINVGDYVKFENGTEKLIKGAGANDSAFRVVSKLPMFYPVVMGQNAPVQNPGNPGTQGGAMSFLPKAGYKFKLEVIA